MPGPPSTRTPRARYATPRARPAVRRACSTAIARRCCTPTPLIPRTFSGSGPWTECCRRRRCITPAPGAYPIARRWPARRLFCLAGISTAPSYLESAGVRLTQLKRMLVAGSALPRLLIEAFAPMGVNVEQGWGMTETSPIVTYNAPTPASAALTGEDAVRQRLKQGRAACGTDMKIVDADGRELPWDGKAFGDFLVRGHWVAREYLNRGAEGAADPLGWFRTGDVCTIDPDGCAEIVDRSKDVI